MPQERDPFPFPRYENDYTLAGSEEIQKLPYDKPTHLAQNDEPWRRLHNTTTQTSSRRNVFHYDTTAPKDSLDIHLKSTYDHHLGLFLNKNHTVTQKKTVAVDNRTVKNKEAMCETEDKGMRVWVNTQRASIYSIKGSIESHHTASTNRGYSLNKTDLACSSVMLPDFEDKLTVKLCFNCGCPEFVKSLTIIATEARGSVIIISVSEQGKTRTRSNKITV